MRRVLIADDDPAFADFLATAASLAGCHVELVHDGVAAVQAFVAASGGFDLVLLDVLLPRQSGLRACSEIRSSPGGRDVPIVMLSGVHKRKERIDEALGLGASEYLLKPVSVSEVWRLLEQYLGLEASPGPAASRDQETPGRPGGFDWRDRATSLEERPLPAVLHELHAARKTGVLFVSDAALVHAVFLEAGTPVFVRSNDRRHRIGAVLRSGGVLTEEQHLRVQGECARDRRRRYGSVVVEAGHVTADQLRETLRPHFCSLILAAFGWPSARAIFIEGSLPSAEGIDVALDVNAIVLDGIRAMDPRADFARHLPHGDRVLRRAVAAAARAGELRLTPVEQQVLGLVDGARSVRQVRAVGTLGEVHVDRSLFTLLHVGLVEVVPTAAGTDQGPDALTAALKAPSGTGGLDPDAPADSQDTLPRLLSRLHAERRSGVIVADAGSFESRIHLDLGQVVAVLSTDERHRIGRLLIEGGLATGADLDAALREHEQSVPRRRLGGVLVERGLLTLEELEWTVVFQVQARIQALFDVERPTCRFEPGPLPAGLEATVSLDTRDVIMEALRHARLEVVRRELPDALSVLRRAEDWQGASAELALTDSERQLLRSLAAPFCVARLQAAGTFPAEFVSRAILGFHLAGLLQQEADVAVGVSPRPGR